MRRLYCLPCHHKDSLVRSYYPPSSACLAPSLHTFYDFSCWIWMRQGKKGNVTKRETTQPPRSCTSFCHNKTPPPSTTLWLPFNRIPIYISFSAFLSRVSLDEGHKWYSQSSSPGFHSILTLPPFGISLSRLLKMLRLHCNYKYFPRLVLADIPASCYYSHNTTTAVFDRQGVGIPLAYTS